MEFVHIPKSKIIIPNETDSELALDDEKPSHTLEIPYDYGLRLFHQA